MKRWTFGTICPIWAVALACLIGCGGSGNGNGTKTVNPQGLVDPSGNWKLVFTDTNNNIFLLSALFSQTGPVVTGLNFSEVGNGNSFQCQAQRDIAMANGLVQNVNQFSGDLSGNFGGIHFTTALNDAGTHATGTYTVTPGTNGNCLGVANSGTLVADEVPSMSGSWTGTVTCISNCPTGGTTGNLTMSLTQDDATGKVNGTYTITGLPGFSNGTIATGTFDLLSGASWQDSMADQNGSNTAIVGGPLNSFGTAGLGLDRSFHGNITTGGSSTPFYSVSMSH